MQSKNDLLRQAMKEAMIEMSRSTDSQEQMAGSWGVVYEHCIELGMTDDAETGEQAVLDFIDNLYRKAHENESVS